MYLSFLILTKPVPADINKYRYRTGTYGSQVVLQKYVGKVQWIGTEFKESVNGIANINQVTVCRPVPKLTVQMCQEKSEVQYR